MDRKLKSLGISEVLLESRRQLRAVPPRDAAAPIAAKVQRRGPAAVLDVDDCEIIVYELFGDRA